MTAETPRWVTSSHSSNGGACVEVAVGLSATGTVPVRGRVALARSARLKRG
ncbi:hypothetical protein GCM10010232_20300 [Streptomyces amakusaensis]